MLSALEAAEPRIQLQVERGRVGKRSGVELKLEDFAAGTSLGMQDSQSKWCRQPIPVGVDSDGRHVSAPLL